MKKKLILPIAAGAVAAAAITYLFATEGGSDAREKIAGLIKDQLPAAQKHLMAFSEKVTDQVSGLVNKVGELA